MEPIGTFILHAISHCPTALKHECYILDSGIEATEYHQQSQSPVGLSSILISAKEHQKMLRSLCACQTNNPCGNVEVSVRCQLSVKKSDQS